MIRRLCIAGLIGLALIATTAGAAPQPEAIGTWVNPHGTAKVQTASCGTNLCGQVVWASDQALADARNSGVRDLLGLQLLHNYRRTEPGLYKGTVYVPDIGHSFTSFIAQHGANKLRISGCIVGGLICKPQNWRRV